MKINTRCKSKQRLRSVEMLKANSNRQIVKLMSICKTESSDLEEFERKATETKRNISPTSRRKKDLFYARIFCFFFVHSADSLFILQNAKFKRYIQSKPIETIHAFALKYIKLFFFFFFFCFVYEFQQF